MNIWRRLRSWQAGVWRDHRAERAAGVALAAVVVVAPAIAQPSTAPTAAPTPAPAVPVAPVSPAPPPESPGLILQELKDQAAAAKPLVKTDAAKAFLAATSRLINPGVRTVWRNREKGIAFSQAEYDALKPEEREGLTKRDCDARFYFTTGYGTPLMYVRPLDLLAEKAGLRSFSGKKICDFGYGTIGHVRLLAECAADVTGVDVEPLFRALYSEQGDSGEIAGVDTTTNIARNGRITLVSGRWPADAPAKAAVSAAAGEGGFDIFISKNTLKRGYIHPARKVDERFLVKLGVDDGTFVQSVHDALKPGGWFMIYNLSPKQNPGDKPYLPHADGQIPFPREMLEKAGFEVLAYDQEDRDAAVDWWQSLGIADGKSKEEVREDLFCWWMLARRK